MGNAALTKASGRSCVPGGGKTSSSSMDERIDALVLRLHEVKSSSSSSSFYIESLVCCHFQTMMMMIMMSLCRDIGVLVSSSSLGKTKRDEEERKKRRKRNAGERAFFCASFRRVFVCDKSVFGILYLSRNHSLFFFSQYYY